MQFISKKSQYVRCPGTELVCSGLCGHWEENLGGPLLQQSFNVSYCAAQSIESMFGIEFFYACCVN